MVVALAGNPNSGKTTIFNALTGSRQHVGNYAGVTVEVKAGRMRQDGRRFEVFDLPGTYSLTACSAEELVARRFLVEERPDVVVDVVDASSLERSLYLAVQFLELGLPLIIVLNMTDVAESRGLKINVAALSALLGVPVVPTVGHKGIGIDELRGAVAAMADAGPVRRTVAVAYHPRIEKAVERIAALLQRDASCTPHAPREAGSYPHAPREAGSYPHAPREAGNVPLAEHEAGNIPHAEREEYERPHAEREEYEHGHGRHCRRRGCGGCRGDAAEAWFAPPELRWSALKLLENDEEERRRVERSASDPGAIFDAVARAAREIELDYGDTAEMAVADARYAFVARVCRESVNAANVVRRTATDRIDAVATHRVWGIPIFLGLMFLVFVLTFTLGRPPMHWLETMFDGLASAAGRRLPPGVPGGWQSLVVDGVIRGVGGVLVFLPNIALLFLAISLLEDSGYMARAAFLTDRLMHKLGLHGKSFIPMLIGFGCTVPAVIGTRVLENRRDRLTTMLVLPLMSCGARLPIYTLLIPAFFPDAWQGPVLWSIYIVGIVLAAGLAKLLRSTVFRGDPAPFVMELPPYRMPTLKSTLLHVGERAWQFVRKAGTIILGFSILLWAMTTYPRPPESRLAGLDANAAHHARLEYSISGRIGRALEPVMRPIGFDWKTSTALIGAVAAKEAFVAQLGIVHSLGAAGEPSESLREALRREYTPLQSYCIMLFCLVSLPCMATFAAVWRESGSWRWAAAQLVGLTLLAYVLTLAVYQTGSALGG